MQHTAEFQAVRAQGKTFRCSSFIFNYWAQPAHSSEHVRRFGIIASRKVGNAVIRNRAKRIFRELFRKHQDALPKHGSFVIIVRSHYRSKTFAAIEASFLKACQEANKGPSS
tara:strand:+ start:2310 stop:2645 length:336 start_codon:yes stop_codon:yes gene_type:complete